MIPEYECTACSESFTQPLCVDWDDPRQRFICPHCHTALVPMTVQIKWTELGLATLYMISLLAIPCALLGLTAGLVLQTGLSAFTAMLIVVTTASWAIAIWLGGKFHIGRKRVKAKTWAEQDREDGVDDTAGTSEIPATGRPSTESTHSMLDVATINESVDKFYFKGSAYALISLVGLPLAFWGDLYVYTCNNIVELEKGIFMGIVLIVPAIISCVLIAKFAVKELPTCPNCHRRLFETSIVIATRNCPRCGETILSPPDLKPATQH